jgi:hypothetical protein
LPSEAAHGILEIVGRPGALGLPDEENEPR